jgi:hypothetical protein
VVDGVGVRVSAHQDTDPNSLDLLSVVARVCVQAKRLSLNDLPGSQHCRSAGPHFLRSIMKPPEPSVVLSRLSTAYRNARFVFRPESGLTHPGGGGIARP